MPDRNRPILPADQSLECPRGIAHATDMTAMTHVPSDAPSPHQETPDRRAQRLAREAGLIAEAEADVTAGRVVPLDDVEAWIDSLGTGHERPVPRSGR